MLLLRPQTSLSTCRLHPCANLDEEEVCPVSLRFQVHRQICTLICFERVAVLKPVLPRTVSATRMMASVDDDTSTKSGLLPLSISTWFSSHVGRLRRSNRLPLQECLAWEFDISFCRAVRSPRAQNKSFAALRSCASLIWRPGYVAMCTDRWQGHPWAHCCDCRTSLATRSCSTFRLLSWLIITALTDELAWDHFGRWFHPTA